VEEEVEMEGTQLPIDMVVVVEVAALLSLTYSMLPI